MEHKLKIWPQYFEKIIDGEKPFEVRKNDRNFSIGDKLILKEWLPDKQKYTGDEYEVEVLDIFDEIKGLKTGYVIMTITEW